MVHLCNMNMSAALKRQRSNRHFDIDRFISQLLASSKFDELAEKLAEKAANKIMHIDAAPSPVKRATVGNETNNSTETTQEVNKKQSNRKDVNKYKTTQLNDVELRKDFTEKIVNATISLSDNLQLKYKYFKINALKIVKSNKDPLPKNDTKEDLTKQNKAIGRSGFRDHNNKKQEPISNQSSTDKNQMKAQKESIDENKRSHSGRPQDKAIIEQEVSHVHNSIREEKASSLKEGNQKHLARSEKNIIEKVEQNDGEPEKRVTGEINENENVIAHFRAHEDSFEENKMTSENPNGGISRSNASDESDDHSSEERSPEDQSSKEQSAEDPNSSKLKPVIRKEGDKLYTYVRAPEYEEYHEKLAKWQKEHPDNPADFM